MKRRVLRTAALVVLMLPLFVGAGIRPRAFEDLLELYAAVLDQLQEDLLAAVEAEPQLEPGFATVSEAFPSIKNLLIDVRRWARANRGSSEMHFADALVSTSGLTAAVQQYLSAARDDAVSVPGKVRLVGRGSQLLLHLARLLEPLEETKSGTKVAALRISLQTTASDAEDGAGASGIQQEIKEDIRRIEGKLDRLLARKLVFITSSPHDGDMNDEGGEGLDGADAICNARAREAGLPVGEFRAWLSTSSENARSRVGQGGWVNICDGIPKVVATGIPDLTDGMLSNEIICDENGRDTTGGRRSTVFVWTGTSQEGVATPGFTCDNWTSNFNFDMGTSGLSSPSNVGKPPSAWTDNFRANCNEPLPIYCFQK